MSAAETPVNRWAWWRLLGSELRLIFSRRRNQMGLLVLAGLPVFLGIALKQTEDQHPGSDLLSSATSNGLFLAFGSLTVEMSLFLPLAIAMLCGDSIAGEANLGTLRYLLTVPVARTRLLVIKGVSLMIGALTGVGVVALAGLVTGVSLFGTGPLTTLSGDQVSLAEAFVRLGAAVGYVTAGMAALAMIGLFISTLTEQPIGAMVATMIVSTLMWVLDSIPQLDWLHPWLLPDRWLSFVDLLRNPIMGERLVEGVAVDAAYAAVFALAAWARFTTKDITS